MEEQRKSENALVPALRFEGFSDPWEQRKVGEILQIAFRAVDLEDDKKYQLVTVKRRNEGIVERARMAGRDILVKSYQEILAGDFVISKRQLVHGGNGLVPPHLSRSIVSNEYLVIEESKDISTEFWALISRTKSMYRQYFLSSFGVDIEKLVFDVQDWKKREITLPKRREQEKLETLFQKLDSLIALHQRKHEKLKTVKQSLLEKMFPKEGEDVPEIRFEGFTDPWEQCKLGECGTTYGGLSGKTKEDFGHGDALFVPYTNVFENPITDTGRLEAIEIDSKQNEVRFGDAFFTVSSETPEDVGMSSIWLSDQPDVYLNSFCFGYRQDGSFDPFYLAYMLRAQSMRSKLMLLAQGISRFNISKKKVMELDASCPRIEEQRQIGSFFRNLDSLIALHQRERVEACL